MKKNNKDTDQATPGLPERPHWNPEDGFPIDPATASLESCMGALLALVEHQQVRTLKTLDASVADRYLRSVMASPGVHMPRIMQLAHHHEARSRHAGAGRRHAKLIDSIMRQLPEELPKFVPGLQRWQTVRAYRIVRAHMEDTFWEFWTNYQAWKTLRDARDESYEEDPDAAAYEDEPEADKEAS